MTLLTMCWIELPIVLVLRPFAGASLIDEAGELDAVGGDKY